MKTSIAAATKNGPATEGAAVDVENDVSRREVIVGSLSKSRSRADETEPCPTTCGRTLPVESAIERSVLKQRGGINEAGLWIGSQQAESLLLTRAARDDSTPDETAVSNESARSRKRLTISSAVAGEKHMTISTISVILRKFPRRTISRSAVLLPVTRLESLFAAHRFCGSCGSGKPRRPDC